MALLDHRLTKQCQKHIHPDYRGYRVTGPNKFQKYFPVSQYREAIAEARRQEQKLAEMQALKKLVAKPIRTANRSYDTDCGVSGINLVTQVRAGKLKNYFTPGLTLQVMGEGGTLSRFRRCYDDDAQIDKVFTELLYIARDAHGFRKLPKHWRTKNPPTVKRFRTLAKQMRAAGVRVPSDFLERSR